MATVMSCADDSSEDLPADAPASADDCVEMIVDEAEAGKRLDVFLAARFPNYSRVHLRKAIVADSVTVDGKRTKVAYRLVVGQRILFTPPELPRDGPEPENIPLDILFEDDQMAVVNKSPGMVVHPGKGHWSGTLTAALAYHFANLSSLGGPTRPGIVHRLDRDTSGVILIAKTDEAHFGLSQQFEKRLVQKEYAALVSRGPDLDRDRIQKPIADHPKYREKKAIIANHPSSRSAETTYEVLERFDGFTYLAAFPKTGRTHQIRIHLASVGAPVLCDKLYGGRAEITLDEIARTPGDGHLLLVRQALHARRIALTHPLSGEKIEFEAPLPDDFRQTLEALRTHRQPAN